MRRVALLFALGIALSGCAEEVGRPATPAPGAAFTASDGAALRGHLFGSGDRWVILSHMFPDDQTAWYSFAGQLSARGYHVLTYDFRGYGESQGNKQINLIDRDLTGAVAFVRRQHPRRVVLLGASMGGTASIIVASEEPVDGVIALSAPTAFRGLDASGVAVGVPSLFISAEEDDDNQLSARAFFDQATGEDRSLDIVKGSSHGIHLLDSPEGPQVRSDIFRFLDRYAPAG